MIPKYEIRKQLLRMLMQAGGTMSASPETLLTKLGEGYGIVMEELVREGRIKANYTTTQGIANAVYYIQLTTAGFQAESALRDITIDATVNALEEIKRAIESGSAKPKVLVFDDGSILRVDCTYSEAVALMFTASVKQVKP